MKPAVFLDRDGTMIHDVGYLSRVDDLRWFPWTVDAIRLLNRAGFLVCVTTNQSGIARGLLTEADLSEIHGEMRRVLEAEDAHVTGWFHCPHHPEAAIESLRLHCDCRKPRPGMIHEAMIKFHIDLGRSFVIGDTLADMGLAASAGVRGILVRTGSGDAVARAHHDQVPGAVFVAPTLMEATAWLLGQSGHPRAEA